MKKIFFVLSIASCLALAACNGNNGDSSSSSSDENSQSAQSASTVNNNKQIESTDTIPGQVLNGDTLGLSQDGTPQVDVQQPGMSQANTTPALKTPIPPMSPEDAVKYKEAISLLKNYGDILAKCLDAKNSNKQIDDPAKQQIKELQDKLTELQKAGKMNEGLIELFNVSNEMYNQLLNQ